MPALSVKGHTRRMTLSIMPSKLRILASIYDGYIMITAVLFHLSGRLSRVYQLQHLVHLPQSTFTTPLSDIYQLTALNFESNLSLSIHYPGDSSLLEVELGKCLVSFLSACGFSRQFYVSSWPRIWTDPKNLQTLIRVPIGYSSRPESGLL